MKFKFLAVIAGLILTLTLIQTVTAKKIPAKEVALIAHLVKESKQPGWSSDGDVYLSVQIGKTEYTAELDSGKIISRKKVKPDGGICGDYAVAKASHLDKNKRVTTKGSGQIFKLTGGEWETIALAEGDYACSKLGEMPASVVKCLKVKCF
jgi:hypothetical protein